MRTPLSSKSKNHSSKKYFVIIRIQEKSLLIIPSRPINIVLEIFRALQTASGKEYHKSLNLQNYLIKRYNQYRLYKEVSEIAIFYQRWQPSQKRKRELGSYSVISHLILPAFIKYQSGFMEKLKK